MSPPVPRLPPRFWSRPKAAAALAALVLVQLAFISPALGSAEPHGMDLSIHLCETAQFARAMRAGDLGLWNPSGNCGYAMAYYYQSLPQAVPAAVHVASGGAIPLLTAFQLSLALPIALFPVAVYAALRRTGFGRGEALAAACAAGVVRAAAPWRGWGLEAESVWVSGLGPQAWAMAGFPLAAAWGWRVLKTGRGWGWAAAWGLAVGVAHPMVGVALVPALAALPWWRAGIGRAAARGTALLGIVLAASAFFWLPIVVHREGFGGFPMRAESERGIGVWAFLRTLGTGGLLDDGRWPVLTAGVAVAIAAAARRVRGAPVWLLAQAGAFSALVVGGTFLPKLPWDLLPPTRFLAPLQLALACAAGVGTVAAVRAVRTWAAARQRPAARWTAWGAAAAAPFVLLGGHLASSPRRVLTSRDLPGAHRAELDLIFRALESRPPGRILIGDDPVLDNHWAMYLPFVYAGTPALVANGAAPLQSSPNFLVLTRSPAARLATAGFGVRYLLGGNAHPDAVRGGILVERTPHFSLYAFPEASPWRGQSAGIADEVEAPSRYAATVTVYGATPDRVRLAVTRHPGWRAWVDGVEVPIHATAPHLMAIDVPTGSHAVEFRFRRPGWTWGLVALSPLVLAAGFLLDRRGRRAHRPPPPG